MRLLHTKDFQLKIFYGSDVPSYVILSHTWGTDDEEISLQELHDPTIVVRSGYRKIRKTCELAVELGYEYVWIDTCCIDKTNLTELSEAINSMFNWYKNSAICIAYLADVPQRTQPARAANVTVGLKDSQPLDGPTNIAHSRWFTRGWTLQELLAPKELCFYDEAWTRLGSVAEFADQVEKATGIAERYFRNAQKACVSVKMSWVARRKTTRVEDMSYCLLGLFNINLPLIYGEGDKAFERLQREIFATTWDETLFAWSDPNISHAGLLAPDPSCFKDSGGVNESYMSREINGKFKINHEWPRDPPFKLTNRGFRVQIRRNTHCRLRYSRDQPCSMYFPFACYDESRRPFAVHLVRVELDEWVRLGDRKLAGTDQPWNSVDNRSTPHHSTKIYIPLSLLHMRSRPPSPHLSSPIAVRIPRSLERTKLTRIGVTGDKTTHRVEILPGESQSELPCTVKQQDEWYVIKMPQTNTFLTLQLRLGKFQSEFFMVNLYGKVYVANSQYGDRYHKPWYRTFSSDQSNEYDMLQRLLYGLSTEGGVIPCCTRMDVLHDLLEINRMCIGGKFYFKTSGPKTIDGWDYYDLKRLPLNSGRRWKAEVDTAYSPVLRSVKNVLPTESEEWANDQRPISIIP